MFQNSDFSGLFHPKKSKMGGLPVLLSGVFVDIGAERDALYVMTSVTWKHQETSSGLRISENYNELEQFIVVHDHTRTRTLV